MTSSWSYSEEAFVYSSIKEVMKVWTRGAGKASFSIDVHNGAAELRLNFSLGHPSEPHILPLWPQQMDKSRENLKKQKRKSPSNKRRDQRRAEQFRAKKVSNHSEIVLPFSCQVVPLQKPAENKAVDIPAFSTTASDEKTPEVCDPPAVGAPTKCNVKQWYLDVGAVRKQLFPTKPMLSASEAPENLNGNSVRSQKYQQKEDEMWKKLFL